MLPMQILIIYQLLHLLQDLFSQQILSGIVISGFDISNGNILGTFNFLTTSYSTDSEPCWGITCGITLSEVMISSNAPSTSNWAYTYYANNANIMMNYQFVRSANNYSSMGIAYAAYYNSLEAMVYEGPDKPITSMADYLKCFDISKGAQLTIYVNQPIANSNKAWTMTGDKAGHSFIGITQNGVSRVWGLYPETNASPYNPNDPHAFGNNEGDSYDISISFVINASALQSITTNAINYQKNYDLNSNNCTDYVLGIAGSSGLFLPDPQSTWPNGGGSNPGAFGEALRQMSLPQETTIDTDGGSAINNNGNCN